MRFFSMIKWLASVTAGFIVFAVCVAAQAEEPIVALKGAWMGHVIRHVTQSGFVPYYSGLKLVIEEQNGLQFKGYMIDDVGREETKVTFSGAVDLKNQYLYLRLSSGDVSVGQIATNQRILLFAADGNRDTVTVFKLRKQSPLQSE